MGVQGHQLLLTCAHRLKMLVQLLTVEHTAVTAAPGEKPDCLNAAFGRQTGVGKHLKCCRDKGVTGQQGRSLAKLLMAAGAAPAEIIVVHAGHVIVNE